MRQLFSACWQLPGIRRLWSYCYRRCIKCYCLRKAKGGDCLRKAKGGEDEDPLDVESGCKVAPSEWCGHEQGASDQAALPPLDEERDVYTPGNFQDADDISAVECWQMPELRVDTGRRKGVRIPKGTSLILPDAGGDLIAAIVAHLPVLQQIRPCWHLGYSMAVDGVSLRTLYRQVMEVGPCLLVVEDSNGCIFGTFASEGLRPLNRCHGTHECFLFRFDTAAGSWRAQVFRWSQQVEAGATCTGYVQESGTPEAEAKSSARNKYFEAIQAQHRLATSSPSAMYSDHMGIAAGIDGPAIFIDQDLLRGVTCPSKVFGSPQMSVQQDFVVRNLEVWHWTG